MIKMKTLFVFNHPAPYKVHVFNELARISEIQVIFERIKAKDRPDSFYRENEYNFPVIFMKHGSFSRENSFSGELKRYIKKHHQEYDVMVELFTMVKGVFSTMGTFCESAYRKAVVMLTGLFCSPPRAATGVRTAKTISETHWMNGQRTNPSACSAFRRVRLATTTNTSTNRIISTRMNQ